MYICVCKSVTDGQLRSTVSSGAMSMRDVRRQLDVCSGCGKCGPRVRQLFDEVTTAPLGAAREAMAPA